MQADAYAGFNRLYEAGRKGGPIIEAACWSHARRKFYELAQLKQAAIAIEAVKHIDALFAIEREINGASAEHRLAVRGERSQPLVAALQVYLREQRARLSGKSETARAIDYSLKRAGLRSPGSSTTAGSACPTTPPNGRCVALRSAATTGPSPVPTKAAAVPPPTIPWSRPPRSTASIRAPGSQTCSRGCLTILRRRSMRCFPGTGNSHVSRVPWQPEHPSSQRTALPSPFAQND